MNWTEGNLARHSRGRQAKEVILRQKEHFAKARAGIIPNTSRKISPSVSISFLRQNSSSSLSPRLPRNPSFLHLTTGSSRHGVSSNKRSRDSPASLRDVTSLPVLSCQFGEGSDGQQPQSSLNDAVNGDPLHEKRRRLLLKGDWVGIGMQKPIPLEFSSRSSQSRKWSSHRQPAKSANMKTRHLLGSRYDQMKDRGEPRPTVTRAQDAKVRIGSQEVRLGDRPNPSRLPFSFNSFHYAGRRMESTSSLTDPREVRSASKHRVVKRHSSLVSISETTSESPRAHIRRGKRSSPLSILQPVPRRPIRTRLLTSASLSSDIADSTLAQVGQLNSALASNSEENELWRQWVATSGSQGTTGCSLPEVRETAPEVRISPGVSELNQSGLVHTDIQEAMASSDWVDSCYVSKSAAADNTHESLLNSLSPNPEQPVVDRSGDNNAVLETTTASPQDQPGGEEPDNILDFLQPAKPLKNSKSTLPSPKPPTSKIYHHDCKETQLAHSEGSTQSRHVENHDVSDGNEVGAHEGNNLRPCKILKAERIRTTNAAISGAAEEDPDAVWMKFVFSDDDSEELLTAALKQGQDTASAPSPPPNEVTISEDDHSGQWNCNISTVATVGRTSNSSSNEPDARVADFSSSFYSGVRDTVAELGTTESRRRKGKNRSSSVTTQPSEMISESGSLEVEAPQSLASQDTGDSFRFARPKLFVGKLSNPTATDRVVEPVEPLSMMKRRRGRGRPKKKSKDGRTNIKSIPVYNGDPIEEFEDSEHETQAGGGFSLFGALETE